jgi:hypothetical protein
MNKKRLKALLEEYGSLAIYTYLGLFVVVLAGFAAAIGLGFKAHGAASGAGVLGAAYVATKLTQPLRILATVALTPVLAQVLKRWRPAAAEAPAEPSEEPPAT